MTEWTVESVAARFREAAETARRLPPVRVQGYFNTWPAFLREEWERFSAKDQVYTPIPPSPKAIEQMLEAMRWIQILDIESRHIVWMRADQIEWEQIAKRFGCAIRTVQRRRNTALLNLTNSLNGIGIISATYKEVQVHAKG